MVEDAENERIGRQVSALRGSTPQTAIAEAMQERGHPKWSQSTVWSVEKGTRPLRLTEAHDLAAVLGVQITTLLATPARARVHRDFKVAEKHFEAIQRETVAYLSAVQDLEMALRAAEAAGEERGRVRWLEEQPERAVEIGRVMWEAERDVRIEKQAVTTELGTDQDG